VIKLNIDGAFCPRRTGSWGFMFRDFADEVIAAAAGNMPQALDSFHAEVVACLMGVREAAERGLDNVVVETDSMMLVEAVKGSAYRLAPTQ